MEKTLITKKGKDRGIVGKQSQFVPHTNYFGSNSGVISFDEIQRQPFQFSLPSMV
jgi:hypothetical protein